MRNKAVRHEDSKEHRAHNAKDFQRQLPKQPSTTRIAASWVKVSSLWSNKNSRSEAAHGNKITEQQPNAESVLGLLSLPDFQWIHKNKRKRSSTWNFSLNFPFQLVGGLINNDLGKTANREKKLCKSFHFFLPCNFQNEVRKLQSNDRRKWTTFDIDILRFVFHYHFLVLYSFPIKLIYIELMKLSTGQYR